MGKNAATPDFETIAADLARMGATALASIESIRRRITELARRRGEVEIAPCDATTVRARAERIVDDALADFRSSMVADLLCAPAERFSDSRLHAAITGVPTFALMAAAGNRDALVTALVAEAFALPAVGSPVSEAERETLLASIDRDLLRADVEEESFTRQLEGAGLGANIARRAGANPAVVLARDHELADYLAAGRR